MSGYSVMLKAKGCAQAAAPHVEAGCPKHSVMLGVHVGRLRLIVNFVVCLLKTSQLSYCVWLFTWTLCWSARRNVQRCLAV